MGRLRRLWVAVFWLAVLAGTAISLMPQPKLLSPWFPGADKLQHALAYTVLFLLGRLAGYRSVWQLAIGLFMLGGAIEVAQSFTPTRTAEWLDWVADALGIGVGHFVALWVPGWRARPASQPSALEQKDRR